MSDPLRHLPDVIAGLTPDVRNVWLAVGLSICLLVAALTWIGLSQSSPIRAAEAAARLRLAAPDAQIDSRMYSGLLVRDSRIRGLLVCGSIEGKGPYAALILKRRRNGVASLTGRGDRVMELAISEDSGLTAAQADLLAVCAERS